MLVKHWQVHEFLRHLFNNSYASFLLRPDLHLLLQAAGDDGRPRHSAASMASVGAIAEEHRQLTDEVEQEITEPVHPRVEAHSCRSMAWLRAVSGCQL